MTHFYFIRRALKTSLSGISYAISSVSSKPVVLSLPPAISFELTNYCNLRCPECCTGSGTMTRPQGYLDVNLFKKVVDELRPYLFHINLYYQGEPMLHPSFFNFPEIAGDIRTTVSTNGHYLDRENTKKIVSSGLNRLIVSLDGMDATTYTTYRVNGDYQKVISGIENVAKAIKDSSSRLLLVIQFIVNKNNEHQIPLVRKFAREMSARLELKSMQIIDKSHTEWLPSSDKYSRYEVSNNQLSIKSHLPNRCSRLWLAPVITWNGDVLPCCFDKNAEHIMGNVNSQSFSEIWRNDNFMSFRSALLTNRKKIEICKNCCSGLKGVKI